MQKIHYISNFEYRPLPVNKILNKWSKLSTQLDKNPNVQDSRQSILTMLGKTYDKDKINNVNNTSLLTKSYVDNSGRKRKVATGMSYIQQDKFNPYEYDISYVVGNPKSNVDPRFSGATSSLAEKLKREYLVKDGKREGARTFTITPNSKETSEIYQSKLGARRTPSGLGGLIGNIPLRIKEIDRLPLSTTFGRFSKFTRL